jgi:hypothetical protein
MRLEMEIIRHPVIPRPTVVVCGWRIGCKCSRPTEIEPGGRLAGLTNWLLVRLTNKNVRWIYLSFKKLSENSINLSMFFVRFLFLFAICLPPRKNLVRSRLSTSSVDEVDHRAQFSLN